MNDLHKDALDLLFRIKDSGTTFNDRNTYSKMFPVDVRELVDRELVTAIRDDGAMTLFLTELGIVMKEIIEL